MNRLMKAAILATASIAAVAAPITAASADSWRHRGGWEGRSDWGRSRRHDRNDAVAAGVIGLAAGALIGGALAQPRQPEYYAPAPYSAPPRVIYEQAPAYYPVAPARASYRGGAEPWSRAWYDYCSQQYRSFNPQTGTYRGYDGADHFCSAN
ncbi:BA14K family protein [Paraburkholderia aspalathi]|nr:BA14K family protein [Paraburkholderia aspalathi]